MLDEQLPLECEHCGFAFSRSLGEFFALGELHCPNCMLPFPLSESDVHELARAIEELQDIGDDSMD